MCKPFLFLILLFSACTLPAEREANKAISKSDTTVIQSHDVNMAVLDTASMVSLPPAQKIKKPAGIYQTILPVGEKIEQTILFSNDFTYRLEEKYIDKKDSMIITEGTWAPSDGFIWLYKDQLVGGRYKWEGNTLQYYHPQLKRSFSMNHLQDAIRNAAWRNKAKEGVVLFGVGNEPFWSVEYNRSDTLSFLLSEWDRPVKLKVHSFFSTKDSAGYTAQNDSAQIRVTVFPHFCNDGMSDFTYRHKIRVLYNQHEYNGCGIVYK